MQNGKSCITDQISTSVGFGSTEFHVIREKDNSPVKIYMPYIWALLSNDDILIKEILENTTAPSTVSIFFH